MTQPTLSSVPAEKTVPADAPQISVVVPVYKVEKFVAECLESILSQDFDSFEVVAVDDGSPDNSGKICDEFAARDPRLRVFHKENGGVTSARRLGVERSRGEWICFVDSDDILLPHALSVLFAATKDFPDADIVEGGHIDFRENEKLSGEALSGVPAGGSAGEKPFSVSGLEYAREVALGRGKFIITPWRKIMRRELLLKTGALNIPPEIFCSEDALMNFTAATEARNVVRIPNAVFGRRKNSSGVSWKSVPPELLATLWDCANKIFSTRSREWQILSEFYIAREFGAMFLRATGKFLRSPKIRPLLPILNSPELRKFPLSHRRTLRLILLGVKFPFSLVPEPIFRLAIRVFVKTLNFPRKVLLKLRGRR